MSVTSRGNPPSYAMKRYLQEQNMIDKLLLDTSMGSTAQSVAAKRRTQLKKNVKAVKGLVGQQESCRS
jgi:hypothetical protein